MQRTYLARVVGAVALVVLAAAGYRSILIGLADWRFRAGDLRGIEAAEHLIPGSARYHYAHALAIQQADPTSAEIGRELSRAVALNPRYSEAMLSWSVDKEFSGDKLAARDLLLQARDVDRQLRPSWALANYYYRQGDAERFWPQARECLRLIGVAGFTTGRYDPVPVFQLCWSMQPNAPVILEKAIPPNPQVEAIYLNYLIKNNRLDAQVALASRMIQRATADDLWVLIPHLNMLIASGRMDDAVREWNALIAKKVVPYASLDPEHGASITNGGLNVGPTGGAFNWRTLNPDPVRFTFLEPEHTYRFEFDGAEPQHVDLLSQTAPLLADRTYQLTSHYRAGFSPQDSGLTWSVAVNGNLLPMRVEPGDKALVLEFHTPPGTNAGTFVLNYSRKPGTTILRGPFDLSDTSLKLLPPG